MITMTSRQSPAFTRRMAALKRIVAEGHDIVSRAIGEKTIAVVRARTLAGTDMNGHRFAPYSAAYARRRRAAGLSATPNLSVSGRLLRSMRWQRAGALTRIYVGTSRRGRISDYDLARIHHFGARAGRRHNAVIPPRPFFGLTPSDWATVRETATAALKKVLAVK